MDDNQVYTIQSQRLDRLEEKIDQMADAIVSLARAEEKIVTLTEFNKQQGEQIQNLINRMDRLENMVTQNTSTVNIINKVFWLVAGGLVAAITWEWIIAMGVLN
jgi:predicted RNase H-like nuclease (RuvC/YqgF family)